MQIQAPFELVLFGGLGDLAQRKLLPSMYFLQRDGRLTEGCIYCTTRHSMTEEEFIETVRTALRQHIPAEYLEEEQWEAFARRLKCVELDLSDVKAYNTLKKIPAVRQPQPGVLPGHGVVSVYSRV